MEVLFIARRFPPSVGGMERFAYDLSNALATKVEMRKITWGGSNLWLPLVLPWFFLRASWILLTRPHIRVIHMQDAVQAPVGWLLHVIFHKPYVVVAHGLDITYKNTFYQAVILPFVRRADRIISISKATNEEAVARGVRVEKAQVITLGTHDDHDKGLANKDDLARELDIDLKNRTVLLTTGRLVKRKGVAWFIGNVLPRLVSRHADVLYLIAGDGGEQVAIEDAAAKNGMSSHVRLLGRVTDEMRNLLYRTSDIFVMPNIRVPGDMEGFGIVVHEAATARLPVVASNLEGIADALRDGKNGVLVPSKDTDRFVREISAFIDDKKYRRSFGEKARNYTLKEYSWDNIASQYLAQYHAILHEKK